MDNYIIRKTVSKRGDKYNYKYLDKRENEIMNKQIIKDAKKGLYIPPAYDNVKINLCKSENVLAIGYDTKDRPQYIYNNKFKQEQSVKKFNHMYDFGLKFKEINKQISTDLYSYSDSKEKQVALILKLIMDCNFRVGNEKYCKENNSFGVTTLQKKHIKVIKNKVIIDFNGKKNVRNTCTIKNKKIIRTLKDKRRTLNNNDNIFTFRIGNKYHKIKSSDVNNYLKQFGDFSAKNFRTWGANIEFIVQIIKECKKEFPKSKNDIKITLNKCIKKVADKLHNTQSVCKNNYLDPELMNLFLDNPNKFSATFNFKANQINKDKIITKYIQFLKSLI